MAGRRRGWGRGPSSLLVGVANSWIPLPDLLASWPSWFIVRAGTAFLHPSDCLLDFVEDAVEIPIDA